MHEKPSPQYICYYHIMYEYSYFICQENIYDDNKIIALLIEIFYRHAMYPVRYTPGFILAYISQIRFFISS